MGVGVNRKQLRRGQTYTLFIDPNSPGVRTGVDSALDASWFTLSVGERPSKAEYGEYVLELGLLLLLLLCLARNRGWRRGITDVPWFKSVHFLVLD